jgi:hypothetical protein
VAVIVESPVGSDVKCPRPWEALRMVRWDYPTITLFLPWRGLRDVAAGREEGLKPVKINSLNVRILYDYEWHQFNGDPAIMPIGDERIPT